MNLDLFDKGGAKSGRRARRDAMSREITPLELDSVIIS